MYSCPAPGWQHCKRSPGPHDRVYPTGPEGQENNADGHHPAAFEAAASLKRARWVRQVHFQDTILYSWSAPGWQQCKRFQDYLTADILVDAKNASITRVGTTGLRVTLDRTDSDHVHDLATGLVVGDATKTMANHTVFCLPSPSGDDDAMAPPPAGALPFLSPARTNVAIFAMRVRPGGEGCKPDVARSPPSGCSAPAGDGDARMPLPSPLPTFGPDSGRLGSLCPAMCAIWRQG